VPRSDVGGTSPLHPERRIPTRMIEFEADGVLFDSDGVLIDSDRVVEAG
jgi:hypothetical protein